MSGAEVPPPARLVLGTAGHIDHGKTALVAALTGVDTDRLPEEKARGITIALGFAPLELDGGLSVSMVDVPGHEGLVRTMVSGATGIDVVLLVVAADEGVMPQTREHLTICELLGVTRGVAALTKIDLVDEEVLALADAELCELLGASGLAGAPVVPVSAVAGQGLPELRRALAACLAESAARTPRSGPPRLWIDRVFGVRGFGSVVTGTLVGAALETGQSVELLPSGRRARVRGLQSHGRAAPRIEPGVRCAVNLGGLEVGELSRGEVVTAPGRLAATASMDARIAWLPGAPPLAKPAPVLFLAGTAERLARITPLGGGTLAPGTRGFVRLHLERTRLPLLPGDRFIVRGFARTGDGGWTLGGGELLDVAPPHRRGGDPGLVGDLERLARGDLGDGLRVRIARAGLAGSGAQVLCAQTGLDAEALEAMLAPLAAAGELVRVPPQRWLAGEAMAALEQRTLAALDAFHRAEPLRPGMTRGDLRGRLPGNAAAESVDCAVERLARGGRVEVDGDRLRRAGHRPTLSDEQHALALRIAAEAKAAGLTPPTLREWRERTGAREDRLRDLLAHLEREGRLTRAPGDVWFDRGEVDALRARVVAELRARGELDTRSYKALIGTTRRHAVPLMELFDDERLTARRGDVRVLRRP